jgi:hypothetical protein
MAGAALAAALVGAAPAGGALPQQSGAVDLRSQANLRFGGSEAAGRAGASVALAGDVNGDGVHDVIVGAPQADPRGRVDAGSAFIVYGAAEAGDADLANLGPAGVRIDGERARDNAGYSIAGVGDVDRDGYDDVIVGAPSASPSGRNLSGAAYVVLGRPGGGTIDLGALGERGVRIEGATAFDNAGSAVSGAGDIDGDGRDDVLVGAPIAQPHGRFRAGSSYVVFAKALARRSVAGEAIELATPGDAATQLDGAVAGDRLGSAVAEAGDIDGDGRDDLLLGAPEARRNGRAFSGSAYVVLGPLSPGRIDLAAPGVGALRIDGAGVQDRAGSAVAAAGDLNADAQDDFVVGAPGHSAPGRPSAGAAYVVFGRPELFDGGAPLLDLGALGPGGIRVDGAAADDATGHAVAGAGDVNADGLDDVIVGAPSADPDQRAASGAAAVVFGRAGAGAVDLATLGPAGIQIAGAAALDRAGFSVAGGGDVNEDARDDVLVGAPEASEPDRTRAGAAYAVFGFGRPAVRYSDPVEGWVGESLAPVRPVVSRTGHARFSIDPPLPAGLQLDPDTGWIAGTPQEPAARTSHTVTMTDLAGTTTTELPVTVSRRPPTSPAPSPSSSPAAPPAPSPPSSPPAPSPPSSTAAPPRISDLTVAPRCSDARWWQASDAGGRRLIARFSLTADAIVRFTLRHRAGSPAWRTCPRRGGRVPGRYSEVGSRDVPARLGRNRVVLGRGAAHAPTASISRVRRLGAGGRRVDLTGLARRLRPGTYRLEAAALDASGHSGPAAAVKLWVIVDARSRAVARAHAADSR